MRYFTNGFGVIVIAFVFYLISVELTNDKQTRSTLSSDKDIRDIISETDQHSKYTEHSEKVKAVKRLPSAIIFGVAKCGTRAILSFFRIHPYVGLKWSTDMPEINFFTEHYSKGLEWYRDQMPPSTPGQITMEKSPNYFPNSTVPALIYEFNSSVKLILVVCNPLRRALSQYAGELEHAKEHEEDYPKFEELAIDSKTRLINEHYHTVTYGCYAELLSPWLMWFPLKQIHIVDGDSLRENPVPEINKVEKYLGIQTFINKDHFEYNKTKGFHCLKHPDNGNPVCLGSTKGREHPTVDSTVTKKLNDYYSQCNTRFYEKAKRKFNW